MKDFKKIMTLYEILSIATPVIVIIFGSMMSYILKTITDSITKLDGRVTHLENRFDGRITTLEDKFDGRITTLENKFDSRVSLLEKEIYFIKGLIEGKNLSK